MNGIFTSWKKKEYRQNNNYILGRHNLFRCSPACTSKLHRDKTQFLSSFQNPDHDVIPSPRASPLNFHIVLRVSFYYRQPMTRIVLVTGCSTGGIGYSLCVNILKNKTTHLTMTYDISKVWRICTPRVQSLCQFTEDWNHCRFWQHYWKDFSWCYKRRKCSKCFETYYR